MDECQKTSEISDQKMDNNLTEIDIELNNNELSENVIKKLENEEQQKIDIEEKCDSNSGCTCFGYKPSQIKWTNVFWLTFIHILAVYAFIHAFLEPVKLLTVLFTVALSVGSGFGVSVGAHRLWAHRSFKAHFILKLLLVILEAMAINGSIFSYARDHRNHHKFVDTDADPKNAKRGFFYAHLGWWMLKKKEDVFIYGKKLSHQDLLDEPLVMYQHKFYIPLVIIFAIILPTIVPYFIWNEKLLTSFLVCVVIRTVNVMHHLFTVNSIAHIWGTKPYDKNIGPTESRLTMYLSLGEGSHNYHHTFPYDYANCEKKWWEVFNPSTLFVDICKLLGLAHDLKKPSKEAIQGVIQRKGDPHYFERKDKKSLCVRISNGALEWLCGCIVAFWQIWMIMIFKLITGRETIVF